MRILEHPILGTLEKTKQVEIEVDGQPILAWEGEPIAAAILASGRRVFRYTQRLEQPRGVFCAIGRCTDCVMTVDGMPNVRTCVMPVKAGMKIETQVGLGKWGGGTS
jgi:predicted molibdopterin-dependent oxidoreductase YjgC